MNNLSPPTPGDAAPKKGDDGTRRAKRWLEATTRVSSAYTIDDEVGAERLAFTWPDQSHSYSYDLGGVLIGEPFDKTNFVAEVKKYDNQSDLVEHYEKFLAQSYAHSLDFGSRMFNHFFFITWAPFRATKWKEQLTYPVALAAVEKHRDKIYCNPEQASEPIEDLIKEEVLQKVIDSSWLIVLSDKQEQLVVTDSDRAIIFAQRIRNGGGI